jgi:hypothetical protein
VNETPIREQEAAPESRRSENPFRAQRGPERGRRRQLLGQANDMELAASSRGRSSLDRATEWEAQGPPVGVSARERIDLDGLPFLGVDLAGF